MTTIVVGSAYVKTQSLYLLSVVDRRDRIRSWFWI